jgi:hypothetical protein
LIVTVCSSDFWLPVNEKPGVLFAGGGDLSTTSHRGHVVDSGQYGKGNFYSHCFKIIEIK